jgi:hypothetical protein
VSYLPAFHLVDGAFVRCRDCAAIIYQTDTATHDAWHDEIRAWREHSEQLRQMYEYLADKVIPTETRERVITTVVETDPVLAKLADTPIPPWEGTP